MIIHYRKDPAAVLDWAWDWSEWLAASETITTSVVTVPEGITLDSKVDAPTRVTAWLSGGTARTTYLVACKITTDQGRTDERTYSIEVTDR